MLCDQAMRSGKCREGRKALGDFGWNYRRRFAKECGTQNTGIIFLLSLPEHAKSDSGSADRDWDLTAAAKSEAQIIYTRNPRQFHSKMDCIAYLS